MTVMVHNAGKDGKGKKKRSLFALDLSAARRYFVRKYSDDVKRAGIPASPRKEAARAIAFATFAIIPAVLTTVVAYILTQFPLALAFLCVPFVVFFAKMFGLGEAVRRRAAGVESELFFFAIYCDIMEKTGRGMLGALDALRENMGSDADVVYTKQKAKKNQKGAMKSGNNDNSGGARSLFPAIGRESLVINREIRVFGKSFEQLLFDLGRIHPSVLFRDFLRGYAVSQSAGGTGAAQYLHEKIREYHVTAKQKMQSYASATEMLATVGSFGLVMFPIFVSVGGIMIDEYTLLYLCVFGIVIIPAVIIFLVKKAGSMSPVPSPKIKLRKRALAVCVVVCIVVMFGVMPALHHMMLPVIPTGNHTDGRGAVADILPILPYAASLWEIIAIPLAVWCLVNYAVTRHDLGGASNLERSAPDFIRDINQKTASNPSFFAAFVFAADAAPYTEEFNRILRDVKSRVSLGVEISSALHDINTASWLVNGTMRLLGYAARSGSITPAILERLGLFASHYLETRSELAAKTVTPLMTGYMGSIIVVMMILMIPVSSFSDFAAFDALGNSGVTVKDPNAGFISELVLELNMVLVVVGAFCSMLLVSQIRYATVLHTLHTGVLLSVIVGMLYYDRYGGGMGLV